MPKIDGIETSKRIFVVGDIHAKIDALKTLVEYLRKETNDNFKLISVGDFMDTKVPREDNLDQRSQLLKLRALSASGDKSAQAILDKVSEEVLSTYEYIKNTPEIEAIIGNHELYYIRRHSGDQKGFDTSKIVHIVDGPIKVKELVDYFSTLPYIKTAETNGRKFVITHSGYVPTNDDGTINYTILKPENQPIINEWSNNGVYDFPKENYDEFKQIADTAWKTVHHYDRETNQPDPTHVSGYITVFGHKRDPHDDFTREKDGDIFAVNLDVTNQVNESGKDCALRCIELDNGRIFEVDVDNYITQSQLVRFGQENERRKQLSQNFATKSKNDEIIKS